MIFGKNCLSPSSLKSKSYVNLHDVVIDLFTPAKLNFLSCFFPAIFDIIPNNNRMVPFLYDDLMKLVKKIMLLIFTSDVVNPCTTVSATRKIDFDS